MRLTSPFRLAKTHLLTHFTSKRNILTRVVLVGCRIICTFSSEFSAYFDIFIPWWFYRVVFSAVMCVSAAHIMIKHFARRCMALELYIYILCYVLKPMFCCSSSWRKTSPTPSAPNQPRAKAQEKPFSGQDAWFMLDWRLLVTVECFEKQSRAAFFTVNHSRPIRNRKPHESGRKRSFFVLKEQVKSWSARLKDCLLLESHRRDLFM